MKSQLFFQKRFRLLPRHTFFPDSHSNVGKSFARRTRGQHLRFNEFANKIDRRFSLLLSEFFQREEYLLR